MRRTRKTPRAAPPPPSRHPHAPRAGARVQLSPPFPLSLSLFPPPTRPATSAAPSPSLPRSRVASAAKAPKSSGLWGVGGGGERTTTTMGGGEGRERVTARPSPHPEVVPSAVTPNAPERRPPNSHTRVGAHEPPRRGGGHGTEKCRIKTPLFAMAPRGGGGGGRGGGHEGRGGGPF